MTHKDKQLRTNTNFFLHRLQSAALHVHCPHSHANTYSLLTCLSNVHVFTTHLNVDFVKFIFSVVPIKCIRLQNFIDRSICSIIYAHENVYHLIGKYKQNLSSFFVVRTSIHSSFSFSLTVVLYAFWPLVNETILAIIHIPFVKCLLLSLLLFLYRCF